MAPVEEESQFLVHRSEELLYRTIYAPIDVRTMLKTAETRGRIRRLPVAHLYFGLKELGEEEVLKLLPHVTEEQWSGILDLDLWSGDRANLMAFLHLEGYITQSQDPIARKLIRAADRELWALLFKKKLKVYPRTSEDEYEKESRRGQWMETPDRAFVAELPSKPEEARLIRAVIQRLYELDSQWVHLLMEEARSRTSIELEEAAFQNRKRRVEEMGFQDYFEAIEIYTFLPPEEPLPEKRRDYIQEVSTLPVRLPDEEGIPFLLFQALNLIPDPLQVQRILEEVFFVCNKVLSADRASPAHRDHVRRSIRKAITGMSLGLDWWSRGNLQRAAEGIERHYLQSFFQHGYSRLVELQLVARRLREGGFHPDPGSSGEAVLDALAEKYPMLVEVEAGKVRKRFFRSWQELTTVRQYLIQLQDHRRDPS